MKQITLKELKELCGCETNDDFANTISIWLGELAGTSHFTKDCRNLLQTKSDRIFRRLKELGYYD